MKAILILALAACYYTAATLEQATGCHDDTSCYQQCIEQGADCE